MKKTVIGRAVVISLCVLLCAGLFSCGKKPYAMKLYNVSFSDKIYVYYMACYKQYWLTMLGKTDSAEFWEAESDGVKNSDRLREISEDALKKRLVSNYLFDVYQLKLTSEETKAIDQLVTRISNMMNDASAGTAGVKADDVFGELDISESDLKEILTIDAKTAALQDHFYGEEGIAKITDEQREKYYNENYYRFRLLYLMDGDFVRDNDGNIVYNDEGAAKTTEISDERYEEKLALAKDILQKVRAGEDIEGYIEEYSEELEKDDYKNGHYLCSVNEYGSLISASVMKLKINETGLLDTKYGIYVIQRIELDPGAWKDPENEAGEDFYNFEQLVTEKEFDDHLANFYDGIEIDRSVTDKYKMEELPYTFLWQYVF
ncbi:MAG: hypothetical protein J5879_07675 [Clostridia bacterium]|nr:hypothetical protein [Clostridia bacterium]